MRNILRFDFHELSWIIELRCLFIKISKLHTMAISYAVEALIFEVIFSHGEFFWGIMKKCSSLFCLYSWNVNLPQYYVHVKMFYLTRWSTNICSIALTLLLIVVFWFLIFISTIYYSKEIVQFKYQTWLTFSWHCKSCNVFTIYETLFQNVINIYQ